MKYRESAFRVSAVVIFSTFLCSTATLAFQADSNKQQQSQPKGGEQKVSSLTGCVDEDQGRYLLVDDRTMAPVANLEAEGFPTEGFAKHLGHKVTVRGIVSSGGNRPTIKVRSVETVSETCGPH